MCAVKVTLEPTNTPTPKLVSRGYRYAVGPPNRFRGHGGWVTDAWAGGPFRAEGEADAKADSFVGNSPFSAAESSDAFVERVVTHQEEDER